MQLGISSIETVADGIKTFRLSPTDGSQLPTFAPGAHVEITCDTAEGRLVRHYSLVSSPEDLSAYEIAVLHTESSRGGSRFFHESVRVGDRLEVSVPRNDFRLAEDAARHVLIAGGIGITPILSFAEHLRARGKDYELHYAARSREKMAFGAAIETLHGNRATLYVDREGHSTLDVARVLGPPALGRHVYVCGPRAMIEGVKRAASALGWRSDHVHFETFGAPAPASRRKPVVLRLLQSDMTVTVSPEQSVLEAMEAAGAWVSSECRRGECGKCTVGYAGGTVEHLDVCLTEEARQSQFCPCISRPLSDSLDVEA